ncbi:hypothetical protein V6N11_055973 [Hibiscus sabdariffa]|uniref:Uncharacterized protein n=1 Tax=Hibiscus sabdariffa TaxID=183260 RepID=A0ABR2T2G7_9ROSI
MSMSSSSATSWPLEAPTASDNLTKMGKLSLFSFPILLPGFGSESDFRLYFAVDCDFGIARGRWALMRAMVIDGEGRFWVVDWMRVGIRVGLGVSVKGEGHSVGTAVAVSLGVMMVD